MTTSTLGSSAYSLGQLLLYADGQNFLREDEAPYAWGVNGVGGYYIHHSSHGLERISPSDGVISRVGDSRYDVFNDVWGGSYGTLSTRWHLHSLVNYSSGDSAFYLSEDLAGMYAVTTVVDTYAIDSIWGPQGIYTVHPPFATTPTPTVCHYPGYFGRLIGGGDTIYAAFNACPTPPTTLPTPSSATCP
jgi:hypothetical protein